MKMTLFIDGASRGNPGRAAIGVALYDEQGLPLKEIGVAIGIATNNLAEYVALLYGLQEVLLLVKEKKGEKESHLELTVYSDSELLINQMSGRYRVKNDDIRRLHLLAQHLISGLGKVSFEKISHDENRKADQLANGALYESKNGGEATTVTEGQVGN